MSIVDNSVADVIASDVEDTDTETVNAVAADVDKTDVADAKYTIRNVDYNRLTVDHNRNPRFKEAYAIDGPAGEKARSIHERGLLDALVVSKRSNGVYVILRGNIRYAGIGHIRNTGLPAGTPKADRPAIDRNSNFMDKVKCHVYEDLSLLEELDLVMDHNDNKTGLTTQEKYLAGRTMRVAGMSQTLVASKLGLKSRSGFQAMANVMAMPQCVEDVYLADESDKTAVRLTDDGIKKLYSEYLKDQAIKGSRIKQAGPSFTEAWETFLKNGNPARDKAMPRDTVIEKAGLIADTDVRELVESIAKNDKTLFGASLERLTIRLNDLKAFRSGQQYHSLPSDNS